MSDDTPPRERFDDAERAFVAAADSTGAHVIAAHGMMTALQAQIDALAARMAELEENTSAGREAMRRTDIDAAGATENTIDWQAMEESQRQRDGQRTDEDEAVDEERRQLESSEESAT